MNRFLVFSTLFLVLGLTSCIEILDDITINPDGSGVLKYNINLSASKIRINSILALDSLEGKKVPSIQEIEKQILSFKEGLSKQEGISKVELEMDFENYLFKMTCHFENLERLQTGVKNALRAEIQNENMWLKPEVAWLALYPDRLERSIPDIQTGKFRDLKPEEIDQLKQGSYISISRFTKPVKSFSNPKAMLSKNKLAVMLRENAYSLTQNPKILENTIYLSPEKP